jgi:hypothetical protein
VSCGNIEHLADGLSYFAVHDLISHLVERIGLYQLYFVRIEIQFIEMHGLLEVELHGVELVGGWCHTINILHRHVIVLSFYVILETHCHVLWNALDIEADVILQEFHLGL